MCPVRLEAGVGSCRSDWLTGIRAASRRNLDFYLGELPIMTLALMVSG